MTYPNGVNTGYTYDNLNQLLRLKADLGATPITDFQYVYDAAGNRTRKQQLDFTEEYAYDKLYRLTGVERTGSSTGRWFYTYDAVGNRLSEQINDAVSSSSYNSKNQLLSASGGGPLRWRGTLNELGNAAFTTVTINDQPARMLAGNVFEADLQMTSGNNTVTVEATDVSGNVTTKSYQANVTGGGATYSYDPNGNLTQKVEGSDTWGYEWNAENQLTRVTKNTIEQARFKYDPLGRRVEKVTGDTTTTWTYDGEDIFREANGTTTLKYIQGDGTDEPLAFDDGSALAYFQADGLRSPAKTTNSVGSVTFARQYDAWGNPQAGGTTSGYAFTGREWDPETGLYYYRARYYDPRTSRFISADPIGFLADTNFYRYVFNQPTLLGDPSGLQGESAMPTGGQRCASGPGGSIPKPPASSCSLKKLRKRLGTVTGWTNYFCGNGPRPSPPPGAQRVQVGGFDAEGAWYVTQGDPCVDYCVCRHEQNHVKNHTKFTDLKYLECVAHQTEQNCIEDRCKGAGE